VEVIVPQLINEVLESRNATSQQFIGSDVYISPYPGGNKPMTFACGVVSEAVRGGADKGSGEAVSVELQVSPVYPICWSNTGDISSSDGGFVRHLQTTGRNVLWRFKSNNNVRVRVIAQL